jgi:radical SAM protein with 4Fe4S-binding SPASM domain
LTEREAIALIEDLAELGVPVLLFSGGEPLLRKDLFRLARHAVGLGIQAVLSSNGTHITQEVAQEIKRAGFSYVGVSLDGKEDTHDWFRQRKGAFLQGIAAIRNCRDAGLKVGLRFTLTKYNFPDLPDIFKLTEEEAIPRICLYHLVYAGRGADLKKDDLNFKQTRQVLEFIWEKTFEFYRRGINAEILTVDNHADGVWIYLRLKKYDPRRARLALELLEAQGGNGSGIKMGAIDDCGNIYADQFWRTRILGNIRQRKFSRLWQDGANSLLADLRNRHPLLKGRCQRCSYISICNGNFRARAESAFGDPWAEDPACYLTEQEINSSLSL